MDWAEGGGRFPRKAVGKGMLVKLRLLAAGWTKMRMEGLFLHIHSIQGLIDALC